MKEPDQIRLAESFVKPGTTIKVNASDDMVCVGSITLKPGESATFKRTEGGKWKVDALTWFRQLFR